jgi:hypothetical protein
MKIVCVWDVTPCSLVNRYQGLGERGILCFRVEYGGIGFLLNAVSPACQPTKIRIITFKNLLILVPLTHTLTL